MIWHPFSFPRGAQAIWKLLSSRAEGKNAGADEFLPHLIYVVIRANPPNLHSNVEFISRVRSCFLLLVVFSISTMRLPVSSS